MQDTTTPAELVIPPAAVEAYFVCGCSESGIRAGYKPEALSAVVAAELRRLADDFAGEYVAREKSRDRREREAGGKPDSTAQHFNSAIVQAADALRARADELDGGKP